VVSPNLKFYKDVKVNDVCVKAYVDFGSRICIIRDDFISTCKLNCNWGENVEINGYGGSRIVTMASTEAKLEVDGVSATWKIYVASREAEQIAIIIGQPFTEQHHVKVVKTAKELLFSGNNSRTRRTIEVCVMG
jgi:hypothetical protein